MKYDRCALNTFVLSRFNAFKNLLKRSSLIPLQCKYNALKLKNDQSDGFAEVNAMEKWCGISWHQLHFKSTIKVHEIKSGFLFLGQEEKETWWASIKLEF